MQARSETTLSKGNTVQAGWDLLACTTCFHQSQVYQPICTNLICTELICTKPHFYHPPKMVARTRESSPSRATRSQGRSLMISSVPRPVVDSRSGTDELRYRWALVKPRFGKGEMCRRWSSTVWGGLCRRFDGGRAEDPACADPGAPSAWAKIFFLSSFSHRYFSPRRGCCRVLKFCIGS